MPKKVKKENNKRQVRDISLTFTPHEIRTPLTSVLGYLWLLEHKGGKLSLKQEKYLKKALKGGRDLIDLVNRRIKER